MLNDQRDLFVGIAPKDEKLSAKHRRMILWDDYIPLCVLRARLPHPPDGVGLRRRAVSRVATQVHGMFAVLFYSRACCPSPP